MYFLFLDESGTPPKPDKAQGQYLVLGGVIVPEGSWHGLSGDLVRVKARYGVVGEVKWKFFGSGNSHRDNPLNHLDRGRIDNFRQDLFKVLLSRKSIKLLACVTSISAAYDRPTITDQNDIYHLAYKGLTERFQYFLQDASRTVGQKQLGVVISDHRMSGDDKKLRERHHQMVDKNAAFTSTYENFVETIFFAPSHVSIGIQFADMVAGAVHRAYQYGDRRHFELIRDAFRSSPTGVIDGFGLIKMPKGTFV